MSESPKHADNPAVVHEESDVNVRAILGYGLGLFAVAVIAHLFLWWLQSRYTTQTERAQTIAYPMAVGQQDQLPPEPRLQNNPQQELRDLRAKQQEQLEGYGWVNKESGVAHIPITEAMKIVVQRGLPVREGQK